MFHELAAALDRNTAAVRVLTRIFTAEAIIMSDFETSVANLTTAVTNETTVETSAVAAIQGLAAQVAANKNDPDAIQALADKITASSGTLAAAIAANTTPAAPPTSDTPAAPAS